MTKYIVSYNNLEFLNRSYMVLFAVWIMILNPFLFVIGMPLLIFAMDFYKIDETKHLSTRSFFIHNIMIILSLCLFAFLTLGNMKNSLNFYFN